jgi:hypothetical protein
VSGAPDRLSAALADRYRLERELGAGGMATVYLAHDLKHDRPVALKVLRPELSAILGAERFLSEIRTTANLQHPHILPLFDSGAAEGLLYYVMPYVEGESLRDRLAREKQLPIADAIRIAGEVAAALDYAHRHGVIHRDIKPENVLLHDGAALVADFGIALALSTAGGSRMTETGMSLGTPHYMSPEQAMGEREITARSDIYALGAMTYEMLVGEPPFTGPTAQAIVAKVLTAEPARPSGLRKTVPPAADDAVLTALEKLPADRFGTAAEFAAALAGRATTRTHATGARTGTRRAARLVAGAIALLTVGLAAGRWLLAPASAPPVAYQQKTFHNEAIYNARFTADGQTIVYSGASGSPAPQVFVIRPDYSERTPVGLPNTQLLSVSSTGELAVLLNPRFLGHRLFEGTLARVPLNGGAPRALLDSVREADWSPDGSALAVIRSVGARDRLEYPIGTVLREAAGYLSDPRVSPDGRHVAVMEHPFRWDDRGTVLILGLDGRVVASSPTAAGEEGLAWRRSGREVLFAAAYEGNVSAYVLTLDGRTREVLGGPTDFTVHDVAVDGRVLVSQDAAPYLAFLRAPGAREDQDVSWLDFSTRTTLSRDGAWLAMTNSSSEAGLNYLVMLRRTGGGQWARLGEGDPQDFSPDGRWLLASVPSSPPRLVLYPTGAGTERTVEVGRFEAISMARWFPDGERILLCGNRPGEASRCFTVPAAGGEPQPITPPGTIDAELAPGGDEAVVFDPGTGWARITLPAGRRRDVPALSARDHVARWSPDGRALYVYRRDASTAERLDLATGRRTPLVTVDLGRHVGASQMASVAVADDPRVYAYIIATYSSVLFTAAGLR